MKVHNGNNNRATLPPGLNLTDEQMLDSTMNPPGPTPVLNTHQHQGKTERLLFLWLLLLIFQGQLRWGALSWVPRMDLPNSVPPLGTLRWGQTPLNPQLVTLCWAGIPHLLYFGRAVFHSTPPPLFILAMRFFAPSPLFFPPRHGKDWTLTCWNTLWTS